MIVGETEIVEIVVNVAAIEVIVPRDPATRENMKTNMNLINMIHRGVDQINKKEDPQVSDYIIIISLLQLQRGRTHEKELSLTIQQSVI